MTTLRNMKHFIALVVCLLGLSAHGQINGTNVTSGLIANWTFNDASGITAVDNIGGYNGSLSNNASWSPGLMDGAVLLNGSSSYVVAPSISSFTNGLTISAWVYFRTLTNANNTVCGKINASRYDQIIVQNNGTVVWTYWTTNSTFKTFNSPSSAVRTNSWYHLAFTYDSVLGAVGYTNGVQCATLAATDGLHQFTGSFIVGGDTFATPRWVHGLIDDTRIYNRAINSNEVYQLYTFRPQPTLTNSMANWANAKLVSYKAGANPPTGAYASPDKLASGTARNFKHQ